MAQILKDISERYLQYQATFKSPLDHAQFITMMLAGFPSL
jgi:hypothetical protein